MCFVIITHVPHIIENQQFFAYGPYVREMNIWGKYVEQFHIVAPLSHQAVSAIDISYDHEAVSFRAVKAFSLTSFREILYALLNVPIISVSIFKAMRQASHIHLRCPGNMGLLGAIIQIAFPSTPKTAKYAGNWDPKAKQPLAYRIQKWILSNTYLTRNMKVLVYGEWEGSSRNIKSFFTATYCEKDMIDLDNLLSNRLALLKQSQVRLLFVGTLSKGKQPLYAIQLAEQLSRSGYEVRMELYGEGDERNQLEAYILQKKIQNYVFLFGNQTADIVKSAYMDSHFLILPSQSEGWPKVVAEAMFWGCVPIATSVSCIPTMLKQGQRGLLLTMDIDNDNQQLRNIIDQKIVYQSKVSQAAIWSRQYTSDYFEAEIRKLVAGAIRMDKKINK